MAYALVGTIGTAVQSASGGTASPAFGTGESRTANNLLTCFCAVTGSATLPGTPAGWSVGAQVAGTSCSASIFYKIAAGADAAPVIAAITSAFVDAQLAEWSGGATSSPNDKNGTGTGTASPVTTTGSAADRDGGELCVMCAADRRSVARASNDTWTSNAGTPTAAGNNNGTSSTDHYSMAYILSAAAGGAADTATVTLSITTSITGVAVASMSFRLPPGSIRRAPVLQAVPRATSW